MPTENTPLTSAPQEQPPGGVPSPFTGSGRPTPSEGADRGAALPDSGRRSGIDRRDIAQTPQSQTDLNRRRGPGRRRSDFAKAAEEGEMNREQFLFLMAIEAFKKSNDRMYPTWTDIVEVVRLLGYRKTMPSELKVRNAEDWREPADAPSNTRVVSGARKRAA